MSGKTTARRTVAQACCIGTLYILTLFGPGQADCFGQSPALEGWPQWRGPLGTGVAPQANPPVEWSAEKNIAWKVKLPGNGSGTPIIWGDQIFLQTAVPTGKKIELPPEAPAEPPAGAPPPATPPTATPPATTPPPTTPQSNLPRTGAAVIPVAMKAQLPPTNPLAPPADAKAPAADAKDAPPADKAGGDKGGGGEKGAGGPRRRFRPPPPKPNEYHQFVVMCLDRRTGQTVWEKIACEVVPHEGHHQDHGFASASPLTDGTCLIAYFGSRGMYCYDMQGNLKWEKQLGQMQTAATFGEGISPVLYGNKVIVVWDHQGEDFIAAFDKQTGNELWRTPREENTSWATPLVVEHEGKPQIIVSGNPSVRSYELETGKELWQCSGLTPTPIPTPVAKDGIVYVMTGFRGSKLLAIRLGGRGDLSGTESVVWSRDTDTPYVPSPLLYDGKLFFYKSNNAILTCVNPANGEVYFGPQRLEEINNVYASPIGAAGRVYLAGRNGTVLVIANSEKFEVLATNKLDDRFDASPAAVGNQLFLRGKEHLYCISDNSTAQAK